MQSVYNFELDIMGQYGHVSIRLQYRSPTRLPSSEIRLVVLQQLTCKFVLYDRKKNTFKLRIPVPIPDLTTVVANSNVNLVLLYMNTGVTHK